jgi:hypothetical protein
MTEPSSWRLEAPIVRSVASVEDDERADEERHEAEAE